MTLTQDQRRDILTYGEIALGEPLPDASNETVLARLELDGVGLDCVLKPIVGERPLWDFPDGTLAERELAAAVVDAYLGFGLVPTTVLRADGPRGPGMVQCFVHRDDSAGDPVRLVAGGQTGAGTVMIAKGRLASGAEVDLVHDLSAELRQMALLDVLINNADRKGGHVLRGRLGADPSAQTSTWGIDHGTCFHVEDKLRTVLWGWTGQSLTDEERRVVGRARAAAAELTRLLTPAELQAYKDRIDNLLERGTFPEPTPQWPRLPWPPL